MFHKDRRTQKVDLTLDKNIAVFYFCLPFSTRKTHQQQSGSAFFKSISKVWFLIHCFRAGINQIASYRWVFGE